MTRKETSAIPCPFPYQGSKRAIAKHIIALFPEKVPYLYEPFCGAAAVSIAAAACGKAQRFVLNDINEPLMDLWREILWNPEQLADDYEKLWHEQHQDRKKYFLHIRTKFNSEHLPHHMLYLLARIVKGSVRYSSAGDFNQSSDNRRAGMHPDRMRKNIVKVSSLLSGKVSMHAVDFRDIVFEATDEDLVYMDPPYQGTSFTRDHRYYDGISFEDFVDSLSKMNEKEISYIVSYDGITGNKKHGELLPNFLELQHHYVRAGRSTQATLLGRNKETLESLYLSPALCERLENKVSSKIIGGVPRQQEFSLA